MVMGGVRGRHGLRDRGIERKARACYKCAVPGYRFWAPLSKGSSYGGLRGRRDAIVNTGSCPGRDGTRESVHARPSPYGEACLPEAVFAGVVKAALIFAGRSWQ
jgi:hypothetical protein